MPEITNNWARMDVADPADRKLLIESGVIWRCGAKAVQMAVEDLVAGMVPMNDKVPPEIATIIGKIQASRAGTTPLDPTLAPLAKAWDNTVPRDPLATQGPVVK